MSSIAKLIASLESARSEAAGLGPAAQGILPQLDEALAEVRALAAKNGKADEGKRPEELSSANDG